MERRESEEPRLPDTPTRANDPTLYETIPVLRRSVSRKCFVKVVCFLVTSEQLQAAVAP